MEGCRAGPGLCLPCWPDNGSAVSPQSHGEGGSLKAASLYCGDPDPEGRKPPLPTEGPAVLSHPRDSTFPSTQWEDNASPAVRGLVGTKQYSVFWGEK